MSVHTNINGVWRDTQTVSSNINGAWRDVDKGDVNISGTWRTFYKKMPGQNWIVRDSTATSWKSVCYSDDLGIFCAISCSYDLTVRKVATSPDGINWTYGSLPSTAVYWGNVVYGNGTFVAMDRGSNGSARKIATSGNGLTWTNRTGVNDGAHTALCYGDTPKLFVAAATNTDSIMTSPTGSTWTLRTSPSNGRYACLCYGNGRFVALPDSGIGAYSNYGTSGWTGLNSSPINDISWVSVCYGNGMYVGVSNIYNKIATSADGLTWAVNNGPVINTISACNTICFGNGVFVAMRGNTKGNIAISSVDGSNWVGSSGFGLTSSGKTIESVCYGNGIFVAVGDGQILTSD